MTVRLINELENASEGVTYMSPALFAAGPGKFSVRGVMAITLILVTSIRISAERSIDGTHGTLRRASASVAAHTFAAPPKRKKGRVKPLGGIHLLFALH